MKHHCSSSFDRLSELPSNVIETILMFLPLRDMVRTSVLSSNWRFQWVTVPQLVFEHDLLDEYDKEDGIDTSICKKDIVFGTLLLHHGPIFKFKLDMSCWRSCSEINKIIPLLSRYGIQDLTFVTGGVIIPAADESDEDEEECVKLPSSIFSCVQLKHLSLTRCVFQPLTLVGFNKLISIELIDVDLGRNVYIPCGPLLESLKLETASYIDCFGVEAPNLKSLCFRGRLSSVGCMKTPNLKALSLYVTELNLIKLLRALPLLENLILRGTFPMKSLLVGDSPNELPTVLNNLNMLHFSLAHTRDMDQLSSTLLWIRSQPNLRILKLMDINYPT